MTSKATAQMGGLREIAANIIADYKQHYDFPPQGESYMEDCIMDALESVRSEALEGERVMTLLRGAETTAAQSIEDHLAFWALIDEVEATRRGVVISHATDPLPTLKRKYGPLVDREFLLKTRALLTLSPARVAEGIANVALPIFSNERRVRNGFRNPERRKDKS